MENMDTKVPLRELATNHWMCHNQNFMVTLNLENLFQYVLQHQLYTSLIGYWIYVSKLVMIIQAQFITVTLKRDNAKADAIM